MSDDDRPSRPACANCARRKTKCDRTSPCSNCVTAKLHCHYAHKPPEKKHRVLHSTRYEESLTFISHQLEDLSNTVHSLVERVDGTGERRPGHDFNSIATNFHKVTPPYASGHIRVTDKNIIEDSPSSQSLSRTTDNGPSPAQSSVLSTVQDAQTTAAGIVRTLMQDTKEANSPLYEDRPSGLTSGDLSEYPELSKAINLPPMDAVLRVLAFARTSPQRYFIDFPHANEDDFAELCQRLYFPTRPFTIFAWIGVNCGLFFLFRDLDQAQYNMLHLTKRQVSANVALCSKNIDAAVRSLKLCVTPSFEAVDALICAAFVCMEGAQGFLGWKLASAAAGMCTDLGYNRLPDGYGDRQRSQKRRLFWHVYALDKTLAFNFGRSPNIQDCDVSTERPYPSEDFKSKWGMNFLGYIDFAKSQHEMYKQLFSARAQLEPLSIRSQRVHEFAAGILRKKSEFEKTWNQGNADFLSTPRESVHSLEIGFCSILTLIYRVLPADSLADTDATSTDNHNPLRFHPLCVESGRAALQALTRAWNAVSNEPNKDASQIFINWTALFMPFMPFLAVLGNQILTDNQEDLLLLGNVVKILAAVAEASSATIKLYRAFLRLFNIAELSSRSKEANVKDRKQRHEAAKAPTSTLGRTSSLPPSTIENGETNTVDTSMPDIDMTSLNAPDPTINWQDFNPSNSDWDTFFNEFDLGPGAENAREMMPWFEQHMNDFNTFS